MFVLPFEYATQELFAAEIMPRFVFRSPKMFLDCRLRTDSRMIHARQPKNLKALHSCASRKNVLDGVVEHVAERKHAGNVWRGHHDRERRLRRIRIRNEIAIFHPALIPFWFNGFWIVSLRKLSHCDQSSETKARLQMIDAFCAGDSASPLLKGED